MTKSETKNESLASTDFLIKILRGNKLQYSGYLDVRYCFSWETTDETMLLLEKNRLNTKKRMLGYNAYPHASNSGGEENDWIINAYK